MGLGTSIFILAVGAILTFAVNAVNTQGINVHAVGVILMVIGAIGVLASLIIWGPRTRRTFAEDNEGHRVSVVQRDELQLPIAALCHRE